MSHHNHNHPPATSNIRIAFFLNLAFSIIEVVGGLLTNSVAILSDALHDFGDCLSLALAWYFQKLSIKKRDSKFSYGYKRFSLLGALINSVVLLIGSFFVITASLERLLKPEEANAKGMIILAVLGIIFNGIALLRLKKGTSLNERTVSLHFIEDVLGWVAVLVASIVMLFFHIPILDPLLSLLISCYILFNIYRNLRDTMKVILQGTPDNVNPEDVRKTLLSVDGVIAIHDLHLWTMDGEYNILTTHLIVDSNANITQLKSQCKEKLKAIQIHHPTLEIERENEVCELDDNH